MHVVKIRASSWYFGGILQDFGASLMQKINIPGRNSADTHWEAGRLVSYIHEHQDEEEGIKKKRLYRLISTSAFEQTTIQRFEVNR